MRTIAAMSRWMLATLAATSLLALAPAQAQAQTEIVVDLGAVASEQFLGFGAEWDSADYTESGVTEQDFELIAHRIQWMKPGVVRTRASGKVGAVHTLAVPTG